MKTPAANASRYEHIFRFANDIMLFADTEGRILECNERAVEAYGVPHDRLVGRALQAQPPDLGLAPEADPNLVDLPLLELVQRVDHDPH
ncbi:MAG TPA: PAS domain-containing protein, partial [Thauera sp.]|nr:PAS domain-containing protein [Thauera sp.]